MRQVSIEVRYADSGYNQEGFFVNIIRSQKVNVQVEGDDSFDWTKDATNAYKLWAKVDLPFALVRQLIRFIRINPANETLGEKEEFTLTHYSDDNSWQAETCRYQYFRDDSLRGVDDATVTRWFKDKMCIPSPDGDRDYHMSLIDQIASFSKEDNYQMTL